MAWCTATRRWPPPSGAACAAWTSPSEGTGLELPDGLTDDQQDALERAFARAADLCGNPDVTVSLDSELPLSVGLGSSGALSVAVARALLTAAGREPTLKRVEACALAMEREFHGTPSGVDHTTSARGHMVLFSKGKARQVKARVPVQVVVVIVGERASTKQTVAALRARQARWPARYRRLFGQVGELAKEGARAVERGDLEAMGDLMNMNQGLLSALGLSSQRVESMVYRLRGLGALGAKLTGAGGDGGAVVGLFAKPQAVVKTLSAEGLTCFAATLAAPGDA